MRINEVLFPMGHVLLTGPLMMEGVQRPGDIQAAFGRQVEIIAPDGSTTIAVVKDVALSQPQCGAIQVFLVSSTPLDGKVVLESEVRSLLGRDRASDQRALD
jgi:hypothetical protein